MDFLIEIWNPNRLSAGSEFWKAWISVLSFYIIKFIFGEEYVKYRRVLRHCEVALISQNGVALF